MSYKMHRGLGEGAISVTVAPGELWELEGIRLHLSAGGAASALTVTVDSGFSSTFDAVILTVSAADMTGETDVDYRWSPTRKFLNKDDKIVIAYANGGSQTWGLEVLYKPLGG